MIVPLPVLFCLLTIVYSVDSMEKHEMDLPPLKFGKFQLKSEYKSPRFDSQIETVDQKSMGFLYSSVRKFIHALQPNKFPSYLVKDYDSMSLSAIWKSFRENYIQWLKYEQGLIICGGLCLLAAALFTIVYVLYLCCCVCCCRSKDDRKLHADRRGDLCRRGVGNIFLAAITLCFVFLTATSFLSNQYIHRGVTELPNTLRSSVADASAYRDNSIQLIRKVLVDDFRTFNETVFKAIDSAASVIVHQIKVVTGAISIDKLSAISDRAIDLERNVTSLSRGLRDLESEVRTLRQDLKRLGESLATKLNQCIAEAQARGNIKAKEECERAFVEVNFYTKIPDSWVDLSPLKPLEEELRRVSEFNVASLLDESKKQFENLESQMRENIRQRESEARAKIKEISVELLKLSDSVAVRLEQLEPSDGYALIEDNSVYLEEYEPYRWITGIVICCVLALITLCYAFGLFYGICGKRPNYYDDDCCIRSTGSKLYCMALTLSFLQLMLLMIVVVCLFFIGGNTQIIGCDPLRNPESHRNQHIINYAERVLENQIRLNPTLRRQFPELANINISLIIEQCNENKSFLAIINLEEAYPQLSPWLDGNSKSQKDLEKYLDSILGDVTSASKRISELLPADTESTLRELEASSSKLDGVPAALIPELRSKIRQFDVAKSILKLKTEQDTASHEAKLALATVLDDLKLIEDNSAKRVRDNLEFIVSNLTMLDVRLPNLTADIPRWILLTNRAEQLLANNLTNYVTNTTKAVGDKFKQYVHTYTQHIKYEFEHSVLSCEPVRNLVYNCVRGVCDYTLDPFNVFWASVGIYLLLTIPAMIIVTSLRSLYRRTEPYSTTDYSVVSVCEYRNGTYESRASRHNQSQHSGYSSWRTPTNTNSNYVDNVGSPPPPYSSAKNRGQRWR